KPALQRYGAIFPPRLKRGHVETQGLQTLRKGTERARMTFAAIKKRVGLGDVERIPVHKGCGEVNPIARTERELPPALTMQLDSHRAVLRMEIQAQLSRGLKLVESIGHKDPAVASRHAHR